MRRRLEPYIVTRIHCIYVLCAYPNTIEANNYQVVEVVVGPVDVRAVDNLLLCRPFSDASSKPRHRLDIIHV